MFPDLAHKLFLVLVLGATAVAISYLLGVSPTPNGQLAQVPGTCTDSDWGRNHFTPGAVISGGLSYNDSCYTPTTLYENYCSSGYRKYEYVTCPNGCSSGACIGSCYVGLSLKEAKSGDSAVTFSAIESVTTSEDASALINKYYAEEPSPFYASPLDSVKGPLGKYELWSGRFIIAETFSDPPQGELIELPESIIDLFFPLDQPTRRARFVGIALGGSTALAGTIPFDASKLVCSVDTDNKTAHSGSVTVTLPALSPPPPPPPAGTQTITWTSTTGVSVSSNSLAKTATTGWGNAGAVSAQTLASGDGFVEFTVTETNTHRIVGLSNGNTNSNWDDVDFGLYLYGWSPISVKVYEAGTYRGDFGSFAQGDKLRVAVTAGKVTYSKNGSVFYTSTKVPTYPLLVDSALYDTTATVSNAVVSSGFTTSSPPPLSSAVPLITSGGTASYLRNDFSGWVGFAFKVGASPITITELGRYVVSGSSGTHAVKLVLYNGVNGTDVSGGSVTVNSSGAPAGSYAYAVLASPVTLPANATYFLMSQEVSGGDRWYDYGGNAITLSNVVSPVGPTWAYNNSSDYTVANPNVAQTYGPVNLKYK